MTRVDWIALAVVALAALVGFRKGLIASGLSLAGIVVGAVAGARVAPHLLHGGTASRYSALVALAGAAVGAAVLHTVGSLVGSMLRSGLRIPPLRTLDSVGGLMLGAVAGAGIVWVLGAAALQVPGQTSLRQTVQRSQVLRRLDQVVPPSRLLHVFSRIDPFPSLSGPAPRVAPPTAAILARPAVRAAEASVVRVLGRACGFDVTGSGWVARRGLVVTAAHVVAGERRTTVERPGSSVPLQARVVAFDVHDDVAVLRVPALAAPPLPLVPPRLGAAVAILGFPEDGPLQATAGRVGPTGSFVSVDVYGHGPIMRSMTSLRGRVRHGNSGGPAIDALGRVQATVFGARVDDHTGLGVPAGPVLRALDGAVAPVATGRCVS